jgi:hypothetical protein
VGDFQTFALSTIGSVLHSFTPSGIMRMTHPSNSLVLWKYPNPNLEGLRYKSALWPMCFCHCIIATWHFDLPKIKSVQLLNFGASESWHLCDLRFMSSDNAAASNFLPGAVRAGSPAGGRAFSQHHFRGIITTSMEFSWILVPSFHV